MPLYGIERYTYGFYDQDISQEMYSIHSIYALSGLPLLDSIMEKGLVVIITNKVNSSTQCQSSTLKADKIVSCISKGMSSREEGVIKVLV